MKRTFLAIHFPSGTEYPALVEHLKKNLPHEKYINYCRPDNIHLTLKFIGQTEDLDIPAINEACRKVAQRHQPFTMDFDRTGLFGSNGTPRVLWLGMNNTLKPFTTLRPTCSMPSTTSAICATDRTSFRISPYVALSHWLTRSSSNRFTTVSNKRPISIRM